MNREIKAINNGLWTQRGKSIVTKNLKRWRRSPGIVSVIHELDRCVVEHQADYDVVLYDADLYQRVRAYCVYPEVEFDLALLEEGDTGSRAAPALAVWAGQDALPLG